jgi:hypothetical protein
MFRLDYLSISTLSLLTTTYLSPFLGENRSPGLIFFFREGANLPCTPAPLYAIIPGMNSQADRDKAWEVLGNAVERRMLLRQELPILDETIRNTAYRLYITYDATPAELAEVIGISKTRIFQILSVFQQEALEKYPFLK